MNKIKLKSLDEDFPIDRAKRCIALYKLYMQGIFQVPPDEVVKAFTIHTDEFLEAIGFTRDEIPDMIVNKYKSVRVYIGVDDEATTGEKARDFKMFLVPVNDKGMDVIPRRIPPAGEVEEEFVYDLIAPCPNTCDTSSELFNAHY